MIVSPSPAGGRAPARAFQPFSVSFAHQRPAARAVAALGPRDCRWPQGEPGDEDFAFCGAPSRGPAPYCAAHARLARARRP